MDENERPMYLRPTSVMIWILTTGIGSLYGAMWGLIGLVCGILLTVAIKMICAAPSTTMAGRKRGDRQ